MCLSGKTDADAIEIYCSIASESVFVVLFQLKKDFVKKFPVLFIIFGGAKPGRQSRMIKWE